MRTLEPQLGWRTFLAISLLITGALACAEPQSVTRRQDGDKLHIRGGDLGRFDQNASFAENLRGLIERLAPLTNATTDYEFVVTEQMPAQIRFKQVIDGVPVDARNEVSLDANGTVTEVWLSVVTPNRVPHGAPISKARAMQLAATTYAKHHGRPNAAVEFIDHPGLRYRVTPQGQPLILEYRFGATAEGLESAFVTVNAISEATQVAPASVQ